MMTPEEALAIQLIFTSNSNREDIQKVSEKISRLKSELNDLEAYEDRLKQSVLWRDQHITNIGLRYEFDTDKLKSIYGE